MKKDELEYGFEVFGDFLVFQDRQAIHGFMKDNVRKIINDNNRFINEKNGKFTKPSVNTDKNVSLEDRFKTELRFDNLDVIKPKGHRLLKMYRNSINMIKEGQVDIKGVNRKDFCLLYEMYFDVLTAEEEKELYWILKKIRPICHLI